MPFGKTVCAACSEAAASAAAPSGPGCLLLPDFQRTGRLPEAPEPRRKDEASPPLTVEGLSISIKSDFDLVINYHGKE